jgi:hypothetical protein
MSVALAVAVYIALFAIVVMFDSSSPAAAKVKDFFSFACLEETTFQIRLLDCEALFLNFAVERSEVLQMVFMLLITSYKSTDYHAMVQRLD